jgi:DNA-binding NarL/FixJ family response regulator
VVTVEDRREIRDGLAMLIDSTSDFRCIGRFRSMEEALPAIDHRVPDLVLDDIGLPGMSGIEGMRIIHEKHPGVVIPVLPVYDDDERILEALRAGACGYVPKKTPPDRLRDGLRDAVAGGSPMTPEVRGAWRRSSGSSGRPRGNGLPPDAARVATPEAAGGRPQLQERGRGVRRHRPRDPFHMRRIHEKLRVHSKSEAVAKALKTRLVS